SFLAHWISPHPQTEITSNITFNQRLQITRFIGTKAALSPQPNQSQIFFAPFWPTSKFIFYILLMEHSDLLGLRTAWARVTKMPASGRTADVIIDVRIDTVRIVATQA
ncbi:MAG: hypothetical protein ACYSP9_00995, partial [Planctomycetota bacterium]